MIGTRKDVFDDIRTNDIINNLIKRTVFSTCVYSVQSDKRTSFEAPMGMN